MASGAPALVIVGHGVDRDDRSRGMVDEIQRRGVRARVIVLDESRADRSTPPRWAAAGVEVHRGVRVSAVDPAARRLIAGGVAISFHALVLAAGATVRPGAEGAPGVFALGPGTAADLASLFGAAPPPDLSSLLVAAAASASAWSASCKAPLIPRWRRG
jgi:NADPH-dependent 2,4-dienoyl-CoA reductase/sulfur reductase-like enzyme